MRLDLDQVERAHELNAVGQRLADGALVDLGRAVLLKPVERGMWGMPSVIHRRKRRRSGPGSFGCIVKWPCSRRLASLNDVTGTLYVAPQRGPRSAPASVLGTRACRRLTRSLSLYRSHTHTDATDQHLFFFLKKIHPSFFLQKNNFHQYSTHTDTHTHTHTHTLPLFFCGCSFTRVGSGDWICTLSPRRCPPPQE